MAVCESAGSSPTAVFVVCFELRVSVLPKRPECDLLNPQTWRCSLNTIFFIANNFHPFKNLNLRNPLLVGGLLYVSALFLYNLQIQAK